MKNCLFLIFLFSFMLGAGCADNPVGNAPFILCIVSIIGMAVTGIWRMIADD